MDPRKRNGPPATARSRPALTAKVDAIVADHRDGQGRPWWEEDSRYRDDDGNLTWWGRAAILANSVDGLAAVGLYHLAKYGPNAEVVKQIDALLLAQALELIEHQRLLKALEAAEARGQP